MAGLARSVAGALLLAASAALAAVELAGFDDEVMRAMDDAFKDLEPVLGAANSELSRQDLAVLRDGYQWTLEYFQQDRGAPRAAQITTSGLAVIDDIEKAVAAEDFAAAIARSRDLHSNCKSCHDLYRPKK